MNYPTTEPTQTAIRPGDDAPTGPVSLRNVRPWIWSARGFRSSFAHDLAQERAAKWIASRPFGETKR